MIGLPLGLLLPPILAPRCCSGRSSRRRPRCRLCPVAGCCQLVPGGSGGPPSGGRPPRGRRARGRGGAAGVAGGGAAATL